MEKIFMQLSDFLYVIMMELDPVWFLIPPLVIVVILGSIIASGLLFKKDKVLEVKSELSPVAAKSPLQEELAAPPEAEVSKPTLSEPPAPQDQDIPPSITVAAPPSDVDEIRTLTESSWLSKFTQGMSKTKEQLGSRLGKIITGKTLLDDDLLEDIHETLYRADMGNATVDKLVNGIRKNLATSDKSDLKAVQSCLKGEMQKIFANQSLKTFPLKSEHQPRIILIVGVNGAGKTTSIGKLGAHFLADQQSVLFCAADTYRAAAIDQLKIWADRLEIDIVAHQPGSDPAAVAFDGVKSAMAKKVDNLLIDTAGRLHSKKELMDELHKIKRVIAKDCPGAPHEVWMVLDATTGQNAFHQVQAFKDVVDLTGLVVTKLDGTAKGGVIVGVVDRFELPIRFVGVGEKAADLRPFEAEQYISALF